MKQWIVVFLVAFMATGSSAAPKKAKASTWTAAELEKNAAQLVPVTLTTDTSALPDSEKKALEHIIDAARAMDPIFLRQAWGGNLDLQGKLASDTTALGKARYHLFRQNVGPWLRRDDTVPFLTGVPDHKPKGAGYYPEDMTKEEFQTWLTTLSEKDKAKAIGFFWLVQRTAGKKLELVPYSQAYQEWLAPAARALKEAAKATDNKTLRQYLNTRAEAFGKDDYYESDVAWMDLDSPLEITIGPYETYEDELFGYKAAFEAFVTVRNESETAKLSKFSTQLQDIEDHLPMDAKYKNPKLGAMAPIRVVDQVFASGEARRGVATAAFNLPNDEKVIQEKGSKRVMLHNVQEAKFERILMPLTAIALNKADMPQVQFEPFFTHILMHELAHGIGPHNISVGGKATTVRGELKELYSAIEEAKADITGLFALQYLVDKGVLDKSLEKTMYTTFLAGCFRSVRFGIGEAHGKGIALQFNYLWDEGAFEKRKDGTFQVVPAKTKAAVTKLTGEILTLQAEGSYAKAKALLDKYGVVRPAMGKLLEKMKQIPVDIEPTYPLAGEKPVTAS